MEAPTRTIAAELARSVGILGLLGIVVALRWAATLAGLADALTIGVLFGFELLAASIVTGVKLRRPPAATLAIGAIGGLVLVAAALVNRQPGLDLGLRPAAPFLTWAAVTVLVASAEELILRGAAFASLEQIGGTISAVVVTSAAFALMHVPLYGWHVVPLDLGVGVFLGGLRLLTRSSAAPAAAHVVADLATWWL